MALRKLQLTDFRCLEFAEFSLDSRFTLISGPNASGKTSVLEAMYVLGRGRSFRTPRLEHLIRSGRQKFVVFGECETSGRPVRVGVEGDVAAGTRAKIDGERLSSLAMLAAVFPVQIIDPEVHGLIEDGPHRRRRFLDWGVFHVEQTFVQVWQRFQLALRQRNAALKASQSKSAVGAWNSDLISTGEQLSAWRQSYLKSLEAEASRIIVALLGMAISLNYRTGWSGGQSFESALAASWESDREFGSTRVGPHRAEMVIQLNGGGVKNRISRGQQKLLAAALLMTQLKLFPSDAPMQPTLLIDDPAAELDKDRLLSLITELSAFKFQLIVTTLDPDFSAFGIPGEHFELRSGTVGARHRVL